MNQDKIKDATKLDLIRRLAEELDLEIEIKSKNSGRGERKRNFFTGEFVALYQIAEKLERIFVHYPNEDYRGYVERLVEEYWKFHTRRTGKSKKGGTDARYKHIIKQGARAKLIFQRLQDRLDFWNDPNNGRTREEANRYLKKREREKFFGRPARRIGRIEIKFLDGELNDGALTGEVARLYEQYGDDALSDEVLDALLDNGGPKVVGDLQKLVMYLSKFLDDHASLSFADRAKVEAAIRHLGGG